MIFRAKSKFPIHSWAGRFVGETAFIIGNGPSLLENNISLIENYFTIGINRAFRVILPKILICQDESLYEDSYSSIRVLPCAKVTKKDIDNEDVFTHFTLEHGHFCFGKDPGVLYGGGSTAALAIQMAVAMSFSSIVLLGCDCCYKENKTDFYGENKNHTISTIPNFLAAMDWVKKECPVEIFNCGDAPQWPRITLEDVIKKLSPSNKTHFDWLRKIG